MDATITHISDYVVNERATARGGESGRTGAVLEITRFDSFAQQPASMVAICTGCFGGAAA